MTFGNIYEYAYELPLQMTLMDLHRSFQLFWTCQMANNQKYITNVAYWKNDQTVLSRPVHLKYVRVVQGHVAPSAPENTRSVSDSWFSCLI